MPEHRTNLSVADAARLFEGLTGIIPQSAKEVKDAYRAWMKAHHPDVTGKRDALTLESVQWMNAAYDILKVRDWTEPNHTEATSDPTPEWTDVGGSSQDDESRRREEQLQRWREQQEKQRREAEERHQKLMSDIKLRNEALKNRPLWQKILWGGDSNVIGDDGLSNPGFWWCYYNAIILMVGTVFSIGLGIGFLLILISSLFGPLQIGGSAIAAISIGGTLIIFIGIATTYACIGAWKGLARILSRLLRETLRPTKIVHFVWKIIWKTPVVVVALLMGSLGATQVGWSGAELITNLPLMGPLEDLGTGILLAISAAITLTLLVLVHKIAKPALVLVVPILFYSVAVPGAWNGFASDFDPTRAEVLKHQYANGYALEHMSPRGLFHTCEDVGIEILMMQRQFVRAP
jgi:hypothetical protein